MGLFDTVFMTPSRRCSNCGSDIDQVQTKAFEPGLREYAVGDMITGTPIVSGVVREDLYCPSCNQTPQQVFFAVWHSLLVGICDDANEAEERIRNVDRAELLDYLTQHQQQALQWHDRFSRLYGELQNLHDYQQRSSVKNDSTDRNSPKFFRIREFVDSEDPLGALIRANKPINPEDETEVEGEEETS
ncbi:MAG TPA: hypothetical protein VJ932_05605 [Alkalispirochaeta sp.]|nr:hypothetical protein [Alkalispirochaeta sp.]